MNHLQNVQKYLSLNYRQRTIWLGRRNRELRLTNELLSRHIIFLKKKVRHLEDSRKNNVTYGNFFAGQRGK